MTKIPTYKRRRYSVEEVSRMLELSYSTIAGRCKTLGFKKEFKDNNYRYQLTTYQVNKIADFHNRLPITDYEDLEIIYVTRTTEIYESRLNYTELNKL